MLSWSLHSGTDGFECEVGRNRQDSARIEEQLRRSRCDVIEAFGDEEEGGRIQPGQAES